MRRLLCWLGLHPWTKAPDFAGHRRRVCPCCDRSQGFTLDLWIDETPELRAAVREGLELMAERRP